MSRTGRRAGWVPGLVALVGVGAVPAQGQTPREIMDRVDRLMRGESSHGRVEMQIQTEHWSRSLEMEVWSLGTDFSLVRVTAPPREAGTATLKADQEVWNYLPRVDRTIKVPPSLMMGSWMGSHFTNDATSTSSPGFRTAAAFPSRPRAVRRRREAIGWEWTGPWLPRTGAHGGTASTA